MSKVSCIVASYNEGKRVLPVLQALLLVPSISQIIFVDDGSSDNTYQEVKDMFPNITVIHLMKNHGKTAAVVRGLEEANEKDIFLIDADLENVCPDEIEQSIQKYFKHDIDLLILENSRGDNEFIDSALRKNIFQSGKRLLKKQDLIEVMKMKPYGYQLEVATNKYMMERNKKVYWIPNSAFNPHKTTKYPFLKGIKKDLEMDISIISFLGIIDYLKQILFFGRQKLQ